MQKLLINLLLICFVTASKITSPSKSFEFDTVPIRYSPSDVNISGDILFVDPKELCSDSMNSDVSGRIIFSLNDICTPSKQIQILEQKGALALLIGRKNGFGGIGVSFVLEAKPKEDFSLPSLEVKVQDANEIKDMLKKGEQVVAHVFSLPNEYENLPWILFPIVFLPFSTINLAIAIHKLVVIFNAEKRKARTHGVLKIFQNSLPIPILLDEIIGNIIIFIWAIGAHQSTQLYPRAIPLILLTLDLPFHWASQVMIAFLWNSALNTMKLPGIRGMKKLRLPMLILTLILFIAELTTSISRAVYVSPPPVFSAVTLAMYFIIQLSVSSHFMGTGYRLVKTFLKSTVESYSKRTDNIKRMAKLIAAIGIACHGELVLLIMLIVMTVYNDTPLNSPVGFFVVYFLFTLVISFCIINVFATPQSVEPENTGTPTNGTHLSRVGDSTSTMIKKQSENSDTSV